MTVNRQSRTIRLGTRKSKLAMAQTMLVAEAMKQAEPGLQVEIVPIVTTGDKILDRALTEFGGKGMFISEFEEAILSGTIDVAVHSAKDMPTELLEGLEISAVLPRADAADVFVTVKGRAIDREPMVVGTGSLRRQLQIKERMNVECKLIRGNVNTRLDKLYNGEYDAVILAAAGLERLNFYEDERFEFVPLPAREFTPAGGQAIIAVEGRCNSEFADLFEKINDHDAWLSLNAERLVLKTLNAGCHEAIGVYSYMEDDAFTMMIMKQMNDELVRRTVCGLPEDYPKLVKRLTDGLSENVIQGE